MCVGNYIKINGIKQVKNTEPRKANFGPNLRNFLGDPDQILKKTTKMGIICKPDRENDLNFLSFVPVPHKMAV